MNSRTGSIDATTSAPRCEPPRPVPTTPNRENAVHSWCTHAAPRCCPAESFERQASRAVEGDASALSPPRRGEGTSTKVVGRLTLNEPHGIRSTNPGGTSSRDCDRRPPEGAGDRVRSEPPWPHIHSLLSGSAGPVLRFMTAHCALRPRWPARSRKGPSMSVQGDPGQSVRSVSGGPPWGEPDPWTSALWASADTVGGYAPPRDVPPPALPLPPDQPRRPSRQGLVVVTAVLLALLLAGAAALTNTLRSPGDTSAAPPKPSATALPTVPSSPPLPSPTAPSPTAPPSAAPSAPPGVVPGSPPGGASSRGP